MRFHIKRANDEGAALALVLTMVVILTLWFSAVAMLTQSASSAITNNGQLAQARSAQMNGAFVDALRQLSPLDGTAVTRLGTDQNPLECDTSNGSTIPLQSYTADDGSIVDIQCTQIDRSGLNSAALASFIMVGPYSASATPGLDAGLMLKGQAPDCVAGTYNQNDISGMAGRLTVQGGVINVSGIWAPISGQAEGVECKRFALQQEVGQVPPQIRVPTGGCPISWFSYSVASSGASPTWSGRTFTTADGASGGCIESTDLTDPSGELGSYLTYVVSTLEGVTGKAKLAAGDSATWCDGAINGTIRYLEVNPGVVDATFMSKLNSLTTSVGCAGEKNVTGYAMVFNPGTYRFTTSTDATWSIKAATLSVVGGAPKWAAISDVTRYDVCDNTVVASGVQFQFAGSAKLSVDTGRMSLCPGPNSTKPVFVALSSELATAAGLNFAWTGSGNVFSTGSGNNNGNCVMCATFEGLYFGPSGAANVALNGSSGVRFLGGAVMKALSITATGASRGASSVLPPPPSIGDRVVQLRFNSRSLGYLGTVQVVIKDYFGRRVASGYRILSWRASW